MTSKKCQGAVKTEAATAGEAVRPLGSVTPEPAHLLSTKREGEVGEEEGTSPPTTPLHLLFPSHLHL